MNMSKRGFAVVGIVLIPLIELYAQEHIEIKPGERIRLTIELPELLQRPRISLLIDRRRLELLEDGLEGSQTQELLNSCQMWPGFSEQLIRVNDKDRFLAEQIDPPLQLGCIQPAYKNRYRRRLVKGHHGIQLC